MMFQVYSLNWNMTRQNLFLSGSWDDTIKLWDIHRPQSVSTFAEHTYCVYAANWYAISLSYVLLATCLLLTCKCACQTV